MADDVPPDASRHHWASATPTAGQHYSSGDFFRDGCRPDPAYHPTGYARHLLRLGGVNTGGLVPIRLVALLPAHVAPAGPRELWLAYGGSQQDP